MSDIISLPEMMKQMKEQELQRYCDEQYKLICDQQKKIKQLEEEVEHLKSLLSSTTELLPAESEVIKIASTEEEVLLQAQIHQIYNRGLDRELSLEDTKRLDLLLKNLMALKEKSSKTIEQPKKRKSLPSIEEALVIAEQAAQRMTEDES